MLGSAARTFKSETVNDYELGLKSQMLDGKLIVNATVFDTVLHNFQDRSYDGVEFLIRNAGAVRSRGLDLDGRLRALSNLTFNYGLTYLDSIYTSDTGAPGLEGCTGWEHGGNDSHSSQNLSRSAARLCAEVPRQRRPELELSARFDGYATTFNASENFTSSFLTANTDNPQSRLPGYYTTGSAHRHPFARRQMGIRIFGTNVFDKHYYTSTIAQPLAARWAPPTPRPVPPCTVASSVTLQGSARASRSISNDVGPHVRQRQLGERAGDVMTRAHSPAPASERQIPVEQGGSAIGAAASEP